MHQRLRRSRVPAVVVGTSACVMLLFAPAASAHPTGAVEVTPGLLGSMSADVYAAGCEYQLSVPVDSEDPVQFAEKEGDSAWIDYGDPVDPVDGVATIAWTPEVMGTYTLDAYQEYGTFSPHTTVEVNMAAVGSGQLCFPMPG
ncbi:MAG: hypothetical protein GX610_02950 [Rhodococcus sp.]|nr:hypothetical protein [Rhodococcus sp. (in: high G+C Gram-positive bacteria)]